MNHADSVHARVHGLKFDAEDAVVHGGDELAVHLLANAVENEDFDFFPLEFFHQKIYLPPRWVGEYLESGHFLEVEFFALAKHLLAIGEGETDAVEVLTGHGVVVLFPKGLRVSSGHEVAVIVDNVLIINELFYKYIVI